MTRSTTCPCDAGAAIGSLGLTFMGHYGSYVIEHEAYAFLTDACLSQMSSSLALPTHIETYHSFGKTRGGVHDLHHLPMHLVRIQVCEPPARHGWINATVPP